MSPQSTRRARRLGLITLGCLLALAGCDAADHNDRTDPCPVGTDGCDCAADPPCEDELVCDARERICRPAVGCDELECPPHRLCAEAADGRDAWCSDACEAGWTFSRVSATCTPLPPTCDPDSVTSILAECEAAQRACIEIAGRGRCGACADGFVEDGEDPGGACVPAPVCDDAVVPECTAIGRVCVDGACAGCLPSHVDDGDACVPTNCGGEGVAGGIGDACGALLRTCERSSAEGPDGAIEVAACGPCLTAHLPTDPLDTDSGACRPVETCAALACGDKSRLCVPGDAETDATCGACRAGYRDLGGRCRPIEGAFCEGEGDPANIEPACAAEGRLCDPAGPLGARCGGCVEGRVAHPDTDECVEPTDCATLGCEADGRACVESPTAVCQGCLDHLVEDDAGFCREPFTCGDLSCGRLECEEAPMGSIADARCVTPCRDDQLWNGRECAPCPPCDRAGLAGVERRPTLAGWCICETEPGWFYSTANEVGPVPCDADGDGWVRENARQVFESGDPVLIENARCALREIDRVVLRDEADAVVDTVLLDAPLPLYESVRNDDDATLREDWARAELPTDAWGPEGAGVSAALLNPFTKLCHDPRADYNHNGHADAYEYGSGPLAPGFRADQRPFNTFSYFVELYRGWFEPLGGDPNQGAWHIAERVRATAPEATPVPIRSAGDASWWQSCTRRADPDAEQTPPIGMDFRAEGLNHHSQFKCVVVRDVPEVAQPLEMTPAEAAARFELNDCVASGAPTPADGTNPAELSATCTPRDTAPPPGRALWGAVPYTAYQSNPDHVGYGGGCVNTCAEAMHRHAANENDLMCPGLPVNVPSCLGLDADFGRLECLEVPCDQIDNDGDGQTDEDPPAVCPTGRLGVCADGAPRCEGTTLRCDAPEPANEICDGLDNDCDGTTDEDSSGVPCAAESPSTGLPGVPGLPGVCGVRSTQCIDGVLDCLPDDPYEPGDERTCDGHDNDCDGQTDEGIAGIPVPGQPDGIDYGSGCHTPGENFQGACAETTWQCVGGETVCVPAADPAPEGCPPGAPAGCRRVCDGIDNDCDGATDEDGACLRNWTGSLNLNALLRADDANMGGSRVTMNVSVVFGGQGSEDVSAQMTIEALEQYSRPTEGFIERARTTTAEGTIAQFVGGNRFSVTYIDVDDERDIIKRPGTNPARNPFEDNVQRVQDHDGVTHLHCNGRVPGNEDVLSQAGNYRNDRVGCELRFSIDYIIVPPENPCLGDPVPEVCDGIDNDCDGTVDEVDRGVPERIFGLFSEDTTFDEGDRLVAILEDGSERVIIENQRLSWVEVFRRWRIPQGQYYFEVPGNVLQLRFEEDGDGDTIGVQRLIDQGEGRLPVPDSLGVLAGGETSERTEFGDSLGLGQTCGSAVGICVEGRWTCQDGAAVCAGGVDPTAEPDACDGFDDDCDGQTDEMIREACDTTCGRGTRGCADGSECMAECDPQCGVVGFRRCTEGAQVYGACAYDFPAESCDGFDNDCDDRIDEGFDVDMPCIVGDGACAVEGVWGCTDDGARACSAVPGEPGTETCNGEDDDCDGAIDEAADLTPPEAAEQRGVCAGALQVCDGVNGWVEPDYGLVPDYEDPETTCDGLDNDCDGTPDEAADLDAPPLADVQDGVCAGAGKVCSAGWVEPDYTALADYEAIEVTCNDSKDNDCDGDADGADAVDCP